METKKKIIRHSKSCPHTGVPTKTKKKTKKQPSDGKHTNYESNTDVKEPLNSSYRYFDQYEELFTMRKCPISEKALRLLAMDLLTWAYKESENPKHAMLLRNFFFERKIAYRTVVRWMERSEMLRDAVAEAKLMIGGRREVGALTRDYTDKVFKNLWQYDPDWKAVDEREANLKAKANEEKAKQNITWVLQDLGTSKLVPEKPVENNKEDEKKESIL